MANPRHSGAFSAGAVGLACLWHWRDVEARSWDRPPFHVMSNEDIVRIAEKAVDGKAFSTPRMSNRRRKSFEIILALASIFPKANGRLPPGRRGGGPVGNKPSDSNA